MTKKKRIRLMRILVFTAFLLGGAVSVSYYWPIIKKEKLPEAMETVEKNLRETDPGRMVLKILGVKVEKEAEDQKKDESEDKGEEKKEEGRKQNIVDSVKEKIEKVIIEKSSERVIDILETLPPEEFEGLRKEFCPKFCYDEKQNSP